ncbi:unnamed protein product [Lactuca virosa]|uniref:KIB1-4 beta-propeller domain-containing protein n=1 Tax=Lactuca virosa TaxID=75947 RepID=A0AAU9P038_9ASTR|nr:unnamed protein product [Lactuca virosa]
MTKTGSVSKSQNRGDGCSRKRSMTVGAAPCGVCKSWRSLALSNKTRFMESKPPVSIWISEQGNKREYSLHEFDGREFKFLIPKSSRKTCVGLTCGYLVLFRRKPRDFWLMNPITRHGLRFPKVPSYLEPDEEGVRAILVFSSSISAWVLVVLCRCTSRIWFSISGKAEWNYVSSISSIIDLHDFKGKIYAIDMGSRLYELGLDPEPKLMLLKTKNILEADLVFLEFVCSSETLYAMECISFHEYEVHELDFGEMKWVSPNKKIMEEYAFLASDLKHSAAIKRELWSNSWLQHYEKCAYNYTSGNGVFFNETIWYFPNDCLKVDLKQKGY